MLGLGLGSAGRVSARIGCAGQDSAGIGLTRLGSSGLGPVELGSAEIALAWLESGMDRAEISLVGLDSAKVG